jgi:hypothetical protein
VPGVVGIEFPLHADSASAQTAAAAAYE